MAPSIQLCLIIEHQLSTAVASGEDGQRRERNVPEFETLAVPEGVSYLRRQRTMGKIKLLKHKPKSTRDHAVLEPVARNRTLELLLLNPFDLSGRVNGVSLTPISLLGEGDQFQLTSGCVFHVSLFRRPRVERASGSHVGKTCPICRVPIAEGVRTYVCPSCEARMHCEDEERAEQDRLECARMTSTCPVCSAAVVFEQGFSYYPEPLCALRVCRDQPASRRSRPAGAG